MTTLIGWVSVHSGRIASLYLASDSRISWGVNREWNVGRKLFAARMNPDIFGYYGEVLFPSLVLGQVVEAIDAGGFPEVAEGPQARMDALLTMLQTSLAERRNTAKHDFGIVYVTRFGEDTDSTYFAWRIAYSANHDTWSVTALDLAVTQSRMIFAYGSGSYYIKNLITDRQNTLQAGTSRFIFWALCDCIQSGEDPLSGGAPQVVGIYRSFNAARTFGIVYQGQRYFNGLKLPSMLRDSSVEWRDELFQRVDQETLQRLPGAQRHGR